MISFFEKVYHVVRQIPCGYVTTYGAIARALDNPRSSRAVGYALNACRDPSIPCHRVVNRLGELSSAFMPEGKYTHARLLTQEGVALIDGDRVDLTQHLWHGLIHCL